MSNKNLAHVRFKSRHIVGYFLTQIIFRSNNHKSIRIVPDYTHMWSTGTSHPSYYHAITTNAMHSLLNYRTSMQQPSQSSAYYFAVVNSADRHERNSRRLYLRINGPPRYDSSPTQCFAYKSASLIQKS